MSVDVAADRQRRLRWLVLAVGLTLLGVVCSVAVLIRSGDPGRGAARPPAAAPAPADPAPERTRSSSAAPAPVAPRTADPKVPPVRLTIPAIGVSQDLLRLGLQPDRTVEVPAPRDAEYPGWFRLGPAPGQIGSAVILGHVDSTRGPAVFYELRHLDPGSRVDVRLRNGSTAHFAVRKVVTYLNEDFPARKVYASHGVRALNLVTCGGAYDESRGGYQANVVAYTRLVDTSPPAAGTSQS